MGPYSMDLRERVAAAIDEGEGSERQIAKRFRVSVSFVTGLSEASGRRHPGPQAPRRRAAAGPRFPEQVRLAMLIAEHPDATLNQLKEWGGFACTLTTLWPPSAASADHRRSLHAGERDTPEVQAKRRDTGRRCGESRQNGWFSSTDGGRHGDRRRPTPGHGGVSGPRARCPPRGVRRP